MLVAVIVLMCGVAEGKILWYSFNNRSLDGSVQGLLLSESERVRGTRVFRSSWDHADAFVLRGLVGARLGVAVGVEDFLRDGGPDDYFVMSASTATPPDLIVVRERGQHALCRRRR
jgi:hypothetical protein